MLTVAILIALQPFAQVQADARFVRVQLDQIREVQTAPPRDRKLPVLATPPAGAGRHSLAISADG